MAMTSARDRIASSVRDDSPPTVSSAARRIDDVDRAAWSCAFRDADGAVFASHEFLRALERSTGEVSSFWHVLIWKGDDVAAAASLSTLRVDLALLAGRRTKRLIATARRLAPRLLYVKVLFCGLPLSVGGASLVIGRSDAAAAVEEVERFLAKLTATMRPLVICYKEFAEDQEAVGDALLGLGYVGFETPPMHRFTHRFRDLDDYLGNLRSHYRYDIRRSMRKAERMGLAIRRITGLDEIDAVYTDRVHELYCAVVENSDHKLELLPHSFFIELARELQGRVALTVAEREGRIVAFNWSLEADSTHYLLFCGIDYAANRDGDVYFNLMFAELDHALRTGTRAISFGQTADEFKARLGCEQSRRFAYVRGRRTLVTMALRALSPVLLPAPRVPHPHRIFQGARPELGERQSAEVVGERHHRQLRVEPE